MNYHHKQYAFVILAILSWILSFTALAIYLLGAIGGLLLFAGFLIAMAILFHGMTIAVDATQIRWGFAFGWFGGKIDLSNIESFRPVTNSWRHGIGMKITHDGWVYSVSGFKAVELVLSDGEKYRLGTNDQEQLLAVLARNIKKAS